ncbi:MAG: hypothetical protein FJ319_00520 [SAR202 cluster bacterium]|nr:hypothetical protein [SAR202 cluster bacterium]
MKRIIAGILALSFALLGVANVSADPPSGVPGDHVLDSYIVVLKAGASADKVAATHKLDRGHRYQAVFNGFSAKVPPPEGSRPFRMIPASFQSLPTLKSPSSGNP